jgi:hypothetical protein
VSTLVGWGLTVDVPEPSGATLLCGGLLGVLWATGRSGKRKLTAETR